ncbi:MAG: NAD-dependent epimerase/dehydratase family protein [Candidatus Korobacteraceae bacterium]
MLVCVTGGTGFVGGFLVRDLLAKGTPVRVLARPSPRADALRRAGADIVTGELADADSIARAVKGASIVYHLAAKVGAPGSRQDYLETNVAGTERVLAACAQQKAGQIVYVGSLAAYGPIPEGARIDEDTPFDEQPAQRDPYSESRTAADRLVSSFAQRTGMPAVILRPGIIYGPGRRLPLGILAFQLGKTNVVFGRADNRIPLNYVENFVDAMQMAANRGAGLRQFNIVDDDDLTLRQYHEVKSSIDGTTTRFSSPWPLHIAGPITELLRPMLPMGDLRLSRRQLERSLQNRWYDTGCIREQTGWQPTIPLTDAILRTVNAAVM